MFLRGCVLAIAAFGLTGCDGVTNTIADGLANVGELTGIAEPQDVTSEGIRTLSVLRGDALVRGPEGYCVDQGASNARRGFAVLVGCALLSDEVALMPSLDGLIIVQIGAQETASVTGNEDAFAAFLETEAGRSVLASSGDVNAVQEVSTVTDTSAVLARFEDTSGPIFPDTSGPQWRGFLDVNGRLATISVLSFDRDTLSRSEGERLLVVAMTELAEVNTAAVAEDDVTDAAENG